MAARSPAGIDRAGDPDPAGVGRPAGQPAGGGDVVARPARPAGGGWPAGRPAGLAGRPAGPEVKFGGPVCRGGANKEEGEIELRGGWVLLPRGG